ncbi:MAG: aminotransferase [Spirochaetaceae bacterium]|nr:aminotransferase [Spirochaetaceae bacterium]
MLTDALRLHRADLDHCIHPWTDFAEWTRSGSTTMVRGEGVYVWDASGRRFLDGIGGLWFANVGFGRRELIDAAAGQLARLPQYSYFTNLANPPATELAARLAELAPGDLNHVFYSTGGSTANDTAARIAHFYFDRVGKPSKRYLISRRNAYHGSTFLAATLSGKMGDKRGFQFADGLVHYLSEANCYRMPDGVAGADAYCDYLVAEFERTVADLGADNVACFFAEPIMGAGGVLVAPRGYHRRMKGVCEAHDILYVSDEVVTGFGRLGHVFASDACFGVVPDMIVTAKGITSGYLPLGATIISERLYDGLARTRSDGAVLAHGFTYSGHAAACAVGLANIALLERERICERVRTLGPRFVERLSSLREHPIVGDVRGSHFMLCLELVQDRRSKRPFPATVDIGRRLARAAQERGLIVRPIGNLSVLSPALILTWDQIERIVEILDASLRATIAGLTRDGVGFAG